MPSLLALVVALLAGLAAWLAFALAAARRRAKTAEARLAQAAERQARLDALAMVLAPPLPAAEVAERIMDEALRASGAHTAVLVTTAADGSRLETFAAAGERAGTRAAHGDPQTPLLEAPPRSEASVAAKRGARADDAGANGERTVDEMTLPFVAADTSGNIRLTFGPPARVAARDVAYLEALARHGALALHAARLHDSERKRRRAAESRDKRHERLAEGGAALASSMEQEKALGAAARLAVECFAEACMIETVQAGERVPAAAAHADGERLPALRGLQQRLAAEANAPWGPARVVRNGRPELIEDVNRDDDVPEDHRAALAALDVRSWLTVPLAARGSVVAVASFATAGTARFGPEDLAFAEQLARLASVAIENARSHAEAQQVNRAKDDFLALLSHELRTPLGAVLVWIELLRSEQVEPAVARAVGMIERSMRSLSRLIDELLDVSRIIAGKLSLEKQATDLPAVVDASFESVRPVAEAKGVQISRISGSGLERLSADPNRLRQLVENLLANAVKFTPRGGRVEVSVRRAGDEALIEVGDTGQGIRPELLPFVFDRFRQGDSTGSRAQGGLGLGLTIARHIVELHGGTIQAASEGEGRGSTFTVRLPLEPARVERVAAVADIPAERLLEGVRVLLVDDHEDTLRGLALTLERFGAQVLPVSSARTAFAEIDGFGPNVLVSDLGMPEEDGYQLIRRIRARDDDAARMPAVAVTAYASPEDRRRALAAGYQEHVPKPVQTGRLLEVVARLSGREQRETDPAP